MVGLDLFVFLGGWLPLAFGCLVVGFWGFALVLLVFGW